MTCPKCKTPLRNITVTDSMGSHTVPACRACGYRDYSQAEEVGQKFRRQHEIPAPIREVVPCSTPGCGNNAAILDKCDRCYHRSNAKLTGKCAGCGMYRKLSDGLCKGCGEEKERAAC